MTIEDFANSINACQPSIEQINAHRLRVDERMKERGLEVNSTGRSIEEMALSKIEMIFTYDIDRETDVMEEKLYQLLEKTNIHWNPPGGIDFYNGVVKSTFIDDGLEFAKINDAEKVCINRPTSNIISYFEDQRDFEVLARDLDQFLSFLVEIHRYEMHYIYDVAYKKDERFMVLKEMIKQGLSYGVVRQFIHDFK